MARIGTHNGIFHADDAFACYMLRTVLKGVATIVRTRDNAVLETCDYVVDVGGVYDHAMRRYDHHQKGFAEKFKKDGGALLSAAGLVYRHHGRDVLIHVLGETPAASELDELYNFVYEKYVYVFDCIDTGVEQYPEKTETAYNLMNTSIFGMIARMNPTWREEDADTDKRFEAAIDLCRISFESFVRRQIDVIKAREYVKKALGEVGKAARKEIFVLDKNMFYYQAMHPRSTDMLQAAPHRQPALPSS
uniref:GAMM1 protein n=1 Tax=Metchnikovella dogieli TaxID=2804710 RepID=A0A896WCR7_9MICR|nr:GAMM1 protein [Metchnikovella dogieli]